MAAATDSAGLAGQLASGNATPIAQLGPGLAYDAASRVVRGRVTITWPYNSITKTFAFLVAEPDPRLRRTRGQVRLELRGPAATALVGCGLGAGDLVLFGLDGATWEPDTSPGSIPGSRVEWQVVFQEKLGLQITLEETGETKLIHVDEPGLQDDSPNPVLEALRQQLSPPAQDRESAVASTPIPTARHTSVPLAEDEISSPAFLKRDRISYGSLFDGFDIFEEDGGIKGQGRKRGRYSRHSKNWRFTSRSPSSELERDETMNRGEDETMRDAEPPAAKPSVMDEGCQTVDEEMAPVSVESRTLPITESEKVVDKPTGGQVDQHVQDDAPVEAPVEPQVDAQVDVQVNVQIEPEVAQIDAQVNAQVNAQIEPQSAQIDTEIQTHGSPAPQTPPGLPGDLPTAVGQISDPQQPASGAAGMGSLFGFDVPAESSFSRFGALATAQPTLSIAEQIKQVRFPISHEPQPAYAPTSSLYAPIPETFPNHQVLGLSPQYPTSHLPESIPSVYPELPAETGDPKEALEGNMLETETPVFAPGWEVPSGTTIQDAAASQHGEMLPENVPAAFSSYGNPFEGLGPEDAVYQDGMVHPKQGHEGEAFVEDAEAESMAGHVVRNDEAEDDQDGQPMEEGDYGQREEPDDDDEGYSEDEQPEEAELMEEDGSEQEYDDWSDQSGTPPRSGPSLQQPGRSNLADYDEYDDSDEEQSEEQPLPFQHPGSGPYMRPPRSAPARTSAPVVIDLISDSESEDEGPAPGDQTRGQVPTPMAVARFSPIQRDEDAPMAEAAGALQQPDEGTMEVAGTVEGADALDLLSQTQVIDFATRAAAKPQERAGAEEVAARQLPPRGESRSPPSASRAPSAWTQMLDDMDDEEKTDEGKTELEQGQDDAEVGMENGFRDKDGKEMLGEGKQTSVEMDGQDGADEMHQANTKMGERDEADVLNQEEELEPAETDLAEDEEKDDEAVEHADPVPGCEALPLTILSDSNSDSWSNSSLDDSDAGEEGQDENAAAEAGTEKEISISESGDELVQAAAQDPSDVPATDATIEEKQIVSNKNDNHAMAATNMDVDDLVQEYLCIYTDDLNRKKKKWEYGRMQYHAPSKRVEVYDDEGDFIGELVMQEDTEFTEGHRMQLGQPAGILVEVHAPVGEQMRRRSDLGDTAPKRAGYYDGAADDSDTDMVDVSAGDGTGNVAIDGEKVAASGSPPAEQDQDAATGTGETVVVQETISVEVLSSSPTSSFASQVVEKEVAAVQSSVTKDDVMTDQLHTPTDTQLFGQPLQGVDDVEAEFDVFMQEREEKSPAAAAGGNVEAETETGGPTDDAEMHEADHVQVADDRDDGREPEHTTDADTSRPPSQRSRQPSSADSITVQTSQTSYDLRSKRRTTPPVAAEETTDTDARRRRSSNRLAKSPQETTQEEPRVPDARKTRSQARRDADSPDLSISLARQSLASKKTIKTSMPEMKPANRPVSNDAPETDDSVRMARAALASPSKAADDDDDEAAGAAELKAELVKRLRTDLRECVSVKNLRNHLDKQPNVIGVVTSQPTPAVRAKGGPREYMLSFRITDPGATPHVCEVLMYRAHKEALPTVTPGDAVLFENIKVRSLPRRGFGLQTWAESSYAVFDDGFDEGGLPQIKGPPVEDWAQYAEHARKLKAWYRALDEGALEKLEKSNKKMDEAV